MSASFSLFLSCICSHCHVSLIAPFLHLLFFLHHQLLCTFLPFFFFFFFLFFFLFLLHILQVEPKLISIYHPTAKEVFAVIGTPMEGFFDGVDVVAKAMAPTTPTTTQ